MTVIITALGLLYDYTKITRSWLIMAEIQFYIFFVESLDKLKKLGRLHTMNNNHSDFSLFEKSE